MKWLFFPSWEAGTPSPPLLSGQQRCLQGKAGALGASSWSQKVGGIRGQRNPLTLWLPLLSPLSAHPQGWGEGAVGPRRSGQALVTTDGSARRKRRSITSLREQQHLFQITAPEEPEPLLGTARCPSGRRRPLAGLPWYLLLMSFTLFGQRSRWLFLTKDWLFAPFCQGQERERWAVAPTMVGHVIEPHSSTTPADTSPILQGVQLPRRSLGVRRRSCTARSDQNLRFLFFCFYKVIYLTTLIFAK